MSREKNPGELYRRPGAGRFAAGGAGSRSRPGVGCSGCPGAVRGVSPVARPVGTPGPPSGVVLIMLINTKSMISVIEQRVGV